MNLDTMNSEEIDKELLEMSFFFTTNNVDLLESLKEHLTQEIIKFARKNITSNKWFYIEKSELK